MWSVSLGNPNTCKDIAEQMLCYVRCVVFILAEGCRISVLSACMCTCLCAYKRVCIDMDIHISTHVHMHIYTHFKYILAFLCLSTEEQKILFAEFSNYTPVKNLLST